MERTHLANHRTLLAFVRTFIIFLSSGLAILELNFLDDVDYIGIALVCIAPLILIVGLVSYFTTRTRIDKTYRS